MKVSIATTLAIGLLMSATAFSADAPKDATGLQGTWNLSAGEADGRALPEMRLKGGTLKIEGDDYTVTLADRGPVKGTQKLDSTKEPKTIDITDSSGPNKDKVCLGIYQLVDDTFRAVFAPPGKPRPTSFATRAESGQWMHVWTKAR